MAKERLTDAQRTEYARVAYYYYKMGMTQDEIARRMKMSRQRANRILSECTRSGIVEIKINGYEKAHIDLETKLEQRYGLVGVRVVDGTPQDESSEHLGVAAGEYLANWIQDKDVIGFSRGRAIAALVRHMPYVDRTGLRVTQLMGSWNNEQPTMSVDDIVYRFADRLNASPTVLYAPVIVRNRAFREAIFEEPFFYEAYNVIKACTVAVVGIGNAREQNLFSESARTLRAIDLESLQSNGAVGEICTHFFDRDGHRVSASFHDRVIAVEYDDLIRIPTRIGIAGSGAKVDAIRGALLGGFVNVLITDVTAAQQLVTS